VKATCNNQKRIKAIAGKESTSSRRIFVRLQGAATGAWSNYVTVAVTPKTDKKTSEMVFSLTEIA